MKYLCRITVLRCDCNESLQREYLNGKVTGPCTDFTPGQVFELTEETFPDYPNPQFCSTAWHSVKGAIYKALHGQPYMDYWPFEVSKVVACCSDGLKPVIFEISREEI